MAEVLLYQGDEGFPNLGTKVVKKETPEPGKVYDYGFIAESDLETLKGLASDPGKLEKLNTFFESLRPQTARIFSPETSSDGTIEPETAYTYIKMGLIPLHKPEFDLDGKNFIVFSRLESSIQNNGLFGTEEGLVKAKEAYREYKKNTSKGPNALTVLRETQEELVTAKKGLADTRKDLKRKEGELVTTSEGWAKTEDDLNATKQTLKRKENENKIIKYRKKLREDELVEKEGELENTNELWATTRKNLRKTKLKLGSTTKERDEFLQQKNEAEDRIKALKEELITNNVKNKSLTEELDKKKGIYDFFSDTLLADLKNYGYEGCNGDPVDEIECMKTVKDELEGNQEKKRELQFLLYEAIPQYGKNEEEFKKKLGDLTSELEDKIEAYGLSQAELKEANSELEKKKGIYDYFSDTVMTPGAYKYLECESGKTPEKCAELIVAQERKFKEENERIIAQKKSIEEKLDDLYERAAEENNIEQCKNRGNDAEKKKCEDAIIEELKQIQKYKSQRDMAGAEFAKNVNLNLFYEEVKRRQRGTDATTRDSASCAEAIMSIINREIELNEGKPQEKKKRNQKSKIKKLLETRNKLVVDFFSGDIFTQDETDEIIKNVLGEKAFEEYKNNIQRAQDNPSFLENFRKRIPWKTAAAAIGVTTFAVLAAYLASKNPEEYPDPGPGPDPGSNFTNSSTPNPGPGPSPGPGPGPGPGVDPYNPDFLDPWNQTPAPPQPEPSENPTPDVLQDSDSFFKTKKIPGGTEFSLNWRNMFSRSKNISGLMMPRTERSRILASRLMY